MRRLPLHGFVPSRSACSRAIRARTLKYISVGLTVGVAALPLVMAFAIASGVAPKADVYTAIITGFLIVLLGECRVQIGVPDHINVHGLITVSGIT